MRNILLLLIFLSINKVIACSCSKVPLMNSIANSDFIATAKILQIKPDKKNSELHDIEIEIINLYKGESVKKLKIYSSLKSSCAFFTPLNSEWLIFASKNKNGELGFGYCSGAKRLDRKYIARRFPGAENNYNKTVQLKLQILEYIRNSGIEVTNEFDFRIRFANNCLKNFKGIKIDKSRFALYELTVEKDLSISKVNPIKKFDNETIEQDLMLCLNENIKLYSRKNNQRTFNRSKIVIALYYYPNENGEFSFISQYDL